MKWGAINQNKPKTNGKIIGKKIVPITICFSVILPNINTSGNKKKRTKGCIPNIREPIKSDNNLSSPLNSKKGKGIIIGINRQIRK